MDQPARTLVVFHAHPDDEALLTAGTMARAAAAGHRVVLVVATLALMLSFGLGQPAMTALVADSVPTRIRGSALGLLTLCFLLGGSLGLPLGIALQL